MRYCKICLTLILLALVSCTPREKIDYLDTIESSFLKDSPDSARVLLESFTSRELANPAIRARHALLLSEAYDLCGVQIMSDTLIRKAVGYYRLIWESSYPLSRAYYCMSKIYENQGNRRKAAEFYLKAELLSHKKEHDSAKPSFFEKYGEYGQELILLVEKQNLEERYSRQKTILLIGALFVSVIIVLLLLGIRMQSSDRKKLLSALKELEAEYLDLSNKPARLESISEEARVRLGNKLKAIGCFLENPPEELSSFSDSLDKVKKDRKDILETIGLLFALWFPDYVNFLLEKKLSVSEIGYCALITLGIQTKAMGDIINKASYYKISSSIRKKIGLPVNEKKLGTFLREVFSESFQ